MEDVALPIKNQAGYGREGARPQGAELGWPPQGSRGLASVAGVERGV
jgi:hypothetical protein